VAERVNFANFVGIRALGEAHIDAHEHSVFALDGVRDANSALVALLLAWFRHAHRENREIRFTGATEGLRNLLELTELDELLRVEA